MICAYKRDVPNNEKIRYNNKFFLIHLCKSRLLIQSMMVKWGVMHDHLAIGYRMQIDTIIL